MEKDFDKWNSVKKKVALDIYESNIYAKEGDVWMAILGKNIGFEQNGGGDNFSRPILVIKKFNNKIFWVIPLSTKQKDVDFYYNFSDPKGGNVSAILAQLRLVSIKRFKRKLYFIENTHLQKIKIILRNFIVPVP